MMFVPLEELPEFIAQQPVLAAALGTLVINLLKLETPMSIIGKAWTVFMVAGYGMMFYGLVRYPVERTAWLLTWGGVAPTEEAPTLSGWYVALAVSLVLATLATALLDLRRGGLIAFIAELITAGLALVVVSAAFALFKSYDEHLAFAGRTFGWTLAVASFTAYVLLVFLRWRRQPARSHVREVKFPIV